jgi:hypothetical protein
MVFERFLLPIYLQYVFLHHEAKASERSENERKYYNPSYRYTVYE